MVTEIKRVQGQDAVQTTSTKRGKVAAYQNQQQNGNAQSVDKVTLSDDYQKYAMSARILKQDEAERAAKVSDIKSQVENKTYSVPASKVAESIVSFAAATEDDNII